jgi:hypothetical protein
VLSGQRFAQRLGTLACANQTLSSQAGQTLLGASTSADETLSERIGNFEALTEACTGRVESRLDGIERRMDAIGVLLDFAIKFDPAP